MEIILKNSFDILKLSMFSCLPERISMMSRTHLNILNELSFVKMYNEASVLLEQTGRFVVHFLNGFSIF